MSKVNRTKLEAAYSQLRAAIGMYFHDEDPVPIHTLASAAYDILMHLNRKNGGAQMEIKEATLDRVNPEYRKTIRELMWAPQNFFKHADKDPDETLEFHTLLTEMFLFEGVQKYHELTGEIRAVSTLFSLWFLLHHPEIAPPNEFLNRTKQELQDQELLDSKKIYYERVGSALIDKGLK